MKNKTFLLVLMLGLCSTALTQTTTAIEPEVHYTPYPSFIFASFSKGTDCEVVLHHYGYDICIRHSNHVEYYIFDCEEFPSEEIAMMLQSVEIEHGIVDNIKSDHQNDVVYCRSTVSRETLALILLDYFSI